MSTDSPSIPVQSLDWLPETEPSTVDAADWDSTDQVEHETKPENAKETLPGPGPFPGFRKPFRSLWWFVQVLVGLAFLVGLLALLAAIPGLSLLTLGFLLEAEARVARSGRFRDGFPLLAVSSRMGLILIMVSVFLIPVQLMATQAAARGIIVEGTPLSQSGLRTFMRIVQVGLFVHLLLAIANGGSFARFFRPIKNVRLLVRAVKDGNYLRSLDNLTNQLLELLKPLHHVSIAFKGAVGAFIWLFIPTALIALSHTPRENPGPAALGSILGGMLLIPIAGWLPLLQAHQAVTGRFRAIFDIRSARKIINRVPIRWAIATILLYALALPLYFTKVRLPASDAMWLITPLFVILTYPTRILMGWVYAKGMQKEKLAWFGVRWSTKLFMIPVIAFYGLILFATPFISEAGRAAMFENHAFLLPVPMQQFFGN